MAMPFGQERGSTFRRSRAARASPLPSARELGRSICSILPGFLPYELSRYISMVCSFESAMGELLPLQRLETLREKEPGWTFPDLAGRLVELSAAIPSAELTLAFGLVKDAQREGEPAAWIAARSDSFFPPDVAGSGIDLASLAVVKVKTPAEALRAADKLTRSGAFGLLVMDLGRDPVLPPPLLSRLLS